MFQNSMGALVRALKASLIVAVSAFPAAAQQLLMAESANDRVRQVDWPTPTFITNFIPTLPSALDLPINVKVGPDGMIYLTAQGSVHSVRRYSPNLPPTLSHPLGTPGGVIDSTFVLPPGGNLVTPVGLAFHPTTKRMYVSDITTAKIVVYDLDAGTVVSQITSAILNSPTGIAFDAAGNLYVCDFGNNAVHKLPNNSTTLVPWVGTGSGTLSQPEDVLVQGASLYVTSFGNNKVLRYSATNGSFAGVQAPTGSETLSNVLGLAADFDGNIYVGCNNTGKIEKYLPLGGGYVGTYCTASSPVGLCFYKEAIAPFPARAHEVVATYCPDVISGQPNPSGACVKVVDVRSGGATGKNWLAPMFSNDMPNPLAPNAWTYQNLGPVFAVAIDDAKAPNIFVAATTAYGQFPFGPGGGGAVYKLGGCDGTIYPWIVTGAPVVNSNKLPNSSDLGLGDVCYDRKHHQFFVSNMDDGVIYRFKDAGTTAKLIDSWDPFGSNLDIFGVPELGDRIWGLHVFGDPFYHSSLNGSFLIFSVWLRDNAHKGTLWPAWLTSYVGAQKPNNALFRVQLDAAGAIKPATLALLKVMPYLDKNTPILQYSNPVSDITSAGRILFTGEKTMTGSSIPGVLGSSHYARTLALVGVGVKDVYKVGDVDLLTLEGTNCAGGVGVDHNPISPRWVWSTGDAIQYPGYTVPTVSEYVYGIQRISINGNTLSTPNFSTQTKLIDLDKDIDSADKVQPGDVEVFPFDASTINCPSGGGGPGHG